MQQQNQCGFVALKYSQKKPPLKRGGTKPNTKTMTPSFLKQKPCQILLFIQEFGYLTWYFSNFSFKTVACNSFR
jgi:hypothetical protein